MSLIHSFKYSTFYKLDQTTLLEPVYIERIVLLQSVICHQPTVRDIIRKG